MSDPRRYQRAGVHTSHEGMDALDSDVSEAQQAEDAERDLDQIEWDEHSECQGDRIDLFRAEY